MSGLEFTLSVSVDRERLTIWIVDVHSYEKRFIVCADELPKAYVELQRAIHEFAVSLMLKKRSAGAPSPGFASQLWTHTESCV